MDGTFQYLDIQDATLDFFVDVVRKSGQYQVVPVQDNHDRSTMAPTPQAPTLSFHPPYSVRQPPIQRPGPSLFNRPPPPLPRQYHSTPAPPPFPPRAQSVTFPPDFTSHGAGSNSKVPNQIVLGCDYKR